MAPADLKSSDRIYSAARAAKRLLAAPSRSVRRSIMGVLGCPDRAQAAPVNFVKRSAEQIHEDVDYAIQVTRSHLEHLSGIGLTPHGMRILELGPGVNLAPQLVLASMGARMSVADRFLVQWEDDYHPAFYRAFRDRWKDATPAIDRVLRDRAHSPEVISCFASPAENLSAIPTGSIDIVISNAVLEHIYSMPLVCCEMARVTGAGGINLHQIDLRDHRDFTRPLEFLTMTDDKFEREFESRNGECGNRWRQSEIRSAFEQVGFDVLGVDSNMQLDPSYLEQFLPRLRVASSRYRDWPSGDIMVISALFKLRKKDDPIRSEAQSGPKQCLSDQR